MARFKERAFHSHHSQGQRQTPPGSEPPLAREEMVSFECRPPLRSFPTSGPCRSGGSLGLARRMPVMLHCGGSRRRQLVALFLGSEACSVRKG